MCNAIPVLPFKTCRPTRRHYFLRVNFRPFSLFTRTTRAKINPGYKVSLRRPRGSLIVLHCSTLCALCWLYYTTVDCRCERSVYLYVVTLWVWLQGGRMARDVRNRFFYVGSVSVRFLKNSRFGLEWVWFSSVLKNAVRFRYYSHLLLM